jgi:crotonobetainyl-CoA:carnitine CoA-transferase CaiB-like acyl-CoA transferase
VEASGPLGDLRVLDVGHALAGPFAATMLGDFGAEVIKVERPGDGDAMRRLGPRKDGIPLWWKAAARNKESITLDFVKPRGREVLIELIRRSDVLVENFRPGTLERHGLGWERLHELNPRLVMVRISGFGQTGSRRGQPGFGRIAEAMSGSAQLTGEPGGPPMHVGYSLADTATGLTGAFGALVALLARARTGEGACIDLALYESLFRLIDWQAIAYDQLGTVATRAGNAFPAVLEGVAAGVGRSADDVWVSYSAATDSVLERLIGVVAGERALRDPRFADAEARRLHVREVEVAASAWIAKRPFAEVERAFTEAQAVAGRVYDVEAIFADPTYRERGNLVEVDDEDFGTVRMHGVVPRIVGEPDRVHSPGPALGRHTDDVLSRVLELDREQIAALHEEGVV